MVDGDRERNLRQHIESLELWEERRALAYQLVHGEITEEEFRSRLAENYAGMPNLNDGFDEAGDREKLDWAIDMFRILDGSVTQELLDIHFRRVDGVEISEGIRERFERDWAEGVFGVDKDGVWIRKEYRTTGPGGEEVIVAQNPVDLDTGRVTGFAMETYRVPDVLLALLRTHTEWHPSDQLLEMQSKVVPNSTIARSRE